MTTDLKIKRNIQRCELDFKNKNGLTISVSIFISASAKKPGQIPDYEQTEVNEMAVELASGTMLAMSNANSFSAPLSRIKAS